MMKLDEEVRKFKDNIVELPKLHKSSFIGELEELNAIKEINAKLEMVCSNKATPLIYAVHSKSAFEVVGYLLGKGANPSYRSYGPFENNFQKFVSGQTPLHHAVWKGRDDVCKLLIDSGAELDATNVYGETPLVTAIKANNSDIVKLLLKREANPNCGECLHLAAKKGSSDLCQSLIDSGAKLDARNANKDTPLHVAVRNNNFELVNFLLDKIQTTVVNPNCRLLINAMNEENDTPLHVAVKCNNLKLVELLLKNGAKASCDKRLNCGNGLYLCPLLTAVSCLMYKNGYNKDIIYRVARKGGIKCSSQTYSGECYSGLFRDELTDEDCLWDIFVEKDDAEVAFGKKECDVKGRKRRRNAEEHENVILQEKIDLDNATSRKCKVLKRSER